MSNKHSNDDSKVWVTALKLVLGVVVIVGGVGLALWLAKDREPGYATPVSNDQWGISKDSPVRMKR